MKKFTVNIDSTKTFAKTKILVTFHIPKECFGQKYDLDGEAVLQNGALFYDFNTSKMFKDVKNHGYFKDVDCLHDEVEKLVLAQLKERALKTASSINDSALTDIQRKQIKSCTLIASKSYMTPSKFLSVSLKSVNPIDGSAVVLLSLEKHQGKMRISKNGHISDYIDGRKLGGYGSIELDLFPRFINIAA